MEPLLLLHGALGSAAQFDALKTQLPPGWDVYAPDFPGHGGTPAETPFSIAGFSTFVRRFMLERALARVDIFGYSMGGYVALHLAAQHPGMVKSIFTLGTKFDWTPETAARETAMLDPEKIETKVPAFARALEQRHAPGDWKAVLRSTAAMLLELGNGAALKDEDFAAIRCPVSVNLGEFDNMVTPEESRAAASKMQDGRFDILSGSKHPLEQTDYVLLAKRLGEFFT